jgi:signal transduction histidine kinase
MVEKLRLAKRLASSKRKRLEKDLDYVTQEMYRRNMELAETNQTLSLLRKIDGLTLESHESLEDLCQKIADAITELSSYPFVAILADSPRKDRIELLGFSSTFQIPQSFDRRKLSMSEHDEWVVQPERNKTIDLQAVPDEKLAAVLGVSVGDIEEFRKAVPIKTAIPIKLLARHRIVGVMLVGLTQMASEVSDKDRTLLDRLSEVVGLALDNKLLFEQNKAVLDQLQKSNRKLQDMDETKDEFISMASHQLRTPLTSVKGYLSMVLEGDAGKINEDQRKMLSQAFVSSQRMTYLISDLLNVSRLKTGKFVIEKTPVNLAEVIEQEVAQLEETAKTRDLKLIYDKPKNFPNIMLDETKTRQVIMNFLDNAIYYTPAKGKIEVILSDQLKSIDFIVKDTGIGVPKAMQPHLFTKFYRADNAKRARPDGTGLGLFMAKKVVVAQGGAILFNSEEGKGSTFGFSFPKEEAKADK